MFSPLTLRKWLQKRYWKLSILPFVLLISVPILALFLRLDRPQFLTQLNMIQVQQAIRLSLLTTLTTALLTLLLGTPVAYYLSHGHYRFHRLVDTLVDLPTILPPAVAGVALLMAFGRRGIAGAWLASLGIALPFTPAAVVIAQTFISAPLYIKSAAQGFASVDCELRKSAALDGASRWQTFRFIMLPMAWASIVNGLVMTWSRALGEFGATIIFAGNYPGRTQTMPLAIYIGFELDLNVALTLALLLVCVSFATLILLKGILNRKAVSNRGEILD